MQRIAAYILSLIFLLLAVLHFYWALGGDWALQGAIPTDSMGQQTLTPTPLACTVVGLGLLILSLFYAGVSGMFQLPLPRWAVSAVSYVVPLLFIIRAIGDFQYAGFFKKVLDTEFAQMDTSFYSPLCLSIGLMAWIVARRLKVL